MTIIILKEAKPHKQKILVDGQEMRLNQWANKKAAEEMRKLGASASGESWDEARNNLIQDALANPESHGINFVDGAPADFESSLSEPDIEGERAEMGARFSSDIEDITDASTTDTERAMGGEVPDEEEQDKGESFFDEEGNLKEWLPEAEADWEARQGDIDWEKKQGEPYEGFEGKPYHEMEQEELDADKKRFADRFADKGEGRQTTLGEFGKGQTIYAMKEAWRLLKYIK